MAYTWDEVQLFPVMAEVGTSSSAGMATGALNVDHRNHTTASQLDNVLGLVDKASVRGQRGWSGGHAQVDR